MSQKISKHLRPWGNWRNKRFWLLVLLIVWTVSGFFLVPHLLERALTKTVEDTGRSIEIAGIQSNPFVLSLKITGLEIRDPDSTVISGFEEFYTNVQLSSLFHWAVTFAEIRVVGLHIEEERFDIGDTRWVRLLNALNQSQDNTTSAAEETAPPRLVIHNLIIENGSIGVTDHLAGGFQSRFGPVNVSVNDLRTLPDHVGENEVSIVTPAGGVISWKGDLQIVPLASRGHLTIRGKGLPAALRYADHHLPIGIEGEHLEVNFDYVFEVAADGPRLAIDDLITKTSEIQASMDHEDQPFVTLSEIELKGGSLRWPEQTFEADSLTVDGLAVEARLDDEGRLSLLDAIPQDTQQPAAAAQENGAGDSQWRIGIGEIELRNSSLDFEDRSTTMPGAISVRGMQLALTGANNDPGTEIDTRLSFDLDSGGTLSYAGSVVALPEFTLQGRASVADMALPVLQPWLAEKAKIALGTGTLNLEADINGTPPASLLLEGSTGIHNLEIRDTNRKQRLVGLDALEIERFEFDLANQVAKTSTINLNGAFGRIHIFEDLSTNIGDLAVATEAPTESQPEKESETPGLELSIAGIEITNSSLDFADDSLPLPFNALIGDLNGSLSTLSTSTAEPTRIDLQGQVNEFGQATISGALNPWDFAQESDIVLVFRNLEMASLTPYTIQYAGYAIESGRLDMDLGYKLQARNLEGENKIIIRELELGDKVDHPDAASLPLKLAVALLKDSEGVIDVDLPVSGDLDDPSFKISGIVWKAIGNLITRIVTSPFRFLGNLVGVDSEDFGTLRFEPGRADITPPDREQLLKLAQAMQERPELELTVTGVYFEDLDLPALQEQVLESQLEATKAAMIGTGDVDVLAVERPALEVLFTAAFPDVTPESVQAEFSGTGEEDTAASGMILDEPAYLEALRTRLISAQAIGAAEMEALASERAKAIVEVLQSAGSSEIKASIAGVQAGDSDQGSVLLELEVTVGDPEI